MLTITDKRPGQCQICCQPVVGYQAKFKDKLSGFFCRKCLEDLLDKRLAANAEPKTTQAEIKAR